MTDVERMLERAAGPGVLPPGLADRVVKRARRRRHGKVVVAAGLVAVLAGVALIGLPRNEPPEWTDLSAAVGREVTDADIVAAGFAGTEEIVLLRREANADEAMYGGKAVEVWISTGDGFREKRDYLSYDLACVRDDAVCEQERPELGLSLLRVQRPGRSYVLVQAPAGRAVTVAGRAVGEAPRGVVVEVAGAEMPVISVGLPDGRRYRIPEAPGAVIDY